MQAKHLRTVALVFSAAVCAVAGLAQERPPVEIRTEHLAGNVYMLSGAGGNLALLVGDDGALLVDAEYAQLYDKVAAAIQAVNDQPIRYVVNTHWHFDHVGGNENFAKAGAVIVAHENVRKLMSAEQDIAHIDVHVPASPPAALPALTFTDALTMQWNGEEVRIIHPGPAHTNGDSIVHFRKANVLHVGDICFNGMYPFMDVNAGGSLDGMVTALDQALTLVDENTKIIPGHGKLLDAKELRAYRDMLAKARDRVRALVQEGKSREEVIASKPMRDVDEKWGDPRRADHWIGIVYDGMTRK